MGHEVLKEITLEKAHEDMRYAFPEVEPNTKPFGSRVLVQLRSPKTVSRGGIFIPEEARQTELWNTQVAKVVTLGPVAFKNRETLEPWPEGDWCQPGTYVRVPKYGGDRWEVPVPQDATADDRPESAIFILFNDLDIIGEILGDPRDIVAFLW
jgi:co-chaperonin GroES (HSP10)